MSDIKKLRFSALPNDKNQGWGVINFYAFSTANYVARVLAVIAGVIVYIIGLWMGSVLGLDGTLWD